MDSFLIQLGLSGLIILCSVILGLIKKNFKTEIDFKVKIVLFSIKWATGFLCGITVLLSLFFDRFLNKLPEIVLFCTIFLITLYIAEKLLEFGGGLKK